MKSWHSLHTAEYSRKVRGGKWYGDCPYQNVIFSQWHFSSSMKSREYNFCNLLATVGNIISGPSHAQAHKHARNSESSSSSCPGPPAASAALPQYRQAVRLGQLMWQQWSWLQQWSRLLPPDVLEGVGHWHVVNWKNILYDVFSETRPSGVLVLRRGSDNLCQASTCERELARARVQDLQNSGSQMIYNSVSATSLLTESKEKKIIEPRRAP